jgi:cell division septation protein DedD
MDRTLLERMVGAAVLVLLFVVFAPMLLDGREDDSGGLPDDNAANTHTKVIILNQPAESAAQPVAAKPVKPIKPIKPKTQQSSPAPAVTAGGRSKPVAEAPRKGFAVQLGSFSSRENAVGFAGSLKNAGYAVFVIRGAASSGAVYRVYAGPKDTRKEAEALAQRLAKEGQSVMVIDLAGQQGG